jgi:SAM-dependent methyltransferase
MNLQTEPGGRTESPLDKADDLYLRILKRLIAQKVMEPSMRILVVCGGTADRDTLVRAGFTNFVISNLDADGAGDLGEEEWSYQDAEDLTFNDGEFDFCFVHEGLHHCRSPHRAIVEMFRVARLGILVIEPADNYFTEFGVRLGVGQDYEHAAVFDHDFLFGGVRNSCIPNYIYRFTARELRKTVLCMEPTLALDTRFEYYLEIPWPALRARKSRLKQLAVALGYPVLRLAHAMAPTVVSNQIVGVVLKPQGSEGLHPWIIRQGKEVTVNRPWIAARFTKK